MRARKTTEEARPGPVLTSHGANTIALQRAVEQAEAEIDAGQGIPHAVIKKKHASLIHRKE